MKKKAKEYFRKNGWGDSNVRDQTKINQKYQSKCAEAYRQTIQQEASGTASASKRFLPSSPTSPTFLPPLPPPLTPSFSPSFFPCTDRAFSPTPLFLLFPSHYLCSDFSTPFPSLFLLSLSYSSSIWMLWILPIHSICSNTIIPIFTNWNNLKKKVHSHRTRRKPQHQSSLYFCEFPM